MLLDTPTSCYQQPLSLICLEVTKLMAEVKWMESSCFVTAWSISKEVSLKPEVDFSIASVVNNSESEKDNVAQESKKCVVLCDRIIFIFFMKC